MAGPKAATNVEKTPEQLAQENADLQAKVDALESSNADGVAAAAEAKEKLEKQIKELEEGGDESLKAQIKELEDKLAEKDATIADFIDNRGDKIPCVALRNGKATLQFGVKTKVKGKADKVEKRVEKIEVMKGQELELTREQFNRLGNPKLPSPLVKVNFGL